MHHELRNLLKTADQSLFGTARGHVLIGECYLYLRIGRRYIDGLPVQCLQISRVEVSPNHQRQGHFTRALAEIERMELPIFIENVLNKDWLEALLRKGFRIVSKDEDIPCLFKPLSSGSPSQALATVKAATPTTTA